MKSLNDILLILASISFIVIFGAAIYEHAVLVPTWAAAPPSSLAIFQGQYKLEPQNFWIPIHPLTVLLLILSLITNWKNDRRKNILIVCISYAVILAITFTYFVPEIISIMKIPFQDTVDPSLVHRASMWETLSLIRLAFIGILCCVLLTALTKQGKIVVVHEVDTVPLSYDNDAMGG